MILNVNNVDVDLMSFKTECGFEGGDLIGYVSSDIKFKNGESIFKSSIYDDNLISKLPGLVEDIFIIGLSEDMKMKTVESYNKILLDNLGMLFGDILEDNLSFENVIKEENYFLINVYLKLECDGFKLVTNESDSDYTYEIYFSIIEIINRESMRLYWGDKSV